MTNDPRTHEHRDAHRASVVPDYSDPRPSRRANNITLPVAAAALDVWPARLGEP